MGWRAWHRYWTHGMLLGLACVGLLASPATAAERAFVDLPDDIVGYQIHVLYVIPSDGVDERLDVSGALATSVAAFQTWLRGQTGGRGLRLDTHEGALDVTFVRLGRTDAQMRAYGIFVRDQIENELLAKGFDDPFKLYSVYYGGGSDLSCGGGAWPPTSPGNVAAMYLFGRPPGAPPCASNALAASASAPGYFEFGMLHEIVHTLGFVARCAPNQYRAGHTSDDPTDLMWAGELPWRPATLDPGHDDYFAHQIAGCLDMEDSAFLELASPTALPPPAWPLLPLAELSCGQEGSVKSREASVVTTVRFINPTSEPADLFWLDYQGRRQFFGRLQAWGSRLQGSYVTHPWLLATERGQCLAIFTVYQTGTLLAVLSSPPSVRVARSASQVGAGQLLTVGVEALNPADQSSKDLYVGVILPDGQTAVFFSALGAVAGTASLREPSRFLPMQSVAPGTTLSLPALLQFTLPTTGVLPGTYYFFAALVRRGTFLDRTIDLGDVLALDVQAVTVLP